jgi:hypothetical protein
MKENNIEAASVTKWSGAGGHRAVRGKGGKKGAKCGGQRGKMIMRKGNRTWNKFSSFD